MSSSSSCDSKCSVIIDTNVFVASGFNSDSASAHILEAVRAGCLHMVWNEETQAEIAHVLRQIPPLSWGHVSDLFRQEWRAGRVRTSSFAYIEDPADRKFAALAKENGSVLITLDDDLLAHRERGEIVMLTPREFQERYGPEMEVRNGDNNG